jgi:hypothetical protein
MYRYLTECNYNMSLLTFVLSLILYYGFIYINEIKLIFYLPNKNIFHFLFKKY